MGASKWFFSVSGVILLIGALAIAGKGLNFGIDFESRHADHRAAHALGERGGRPHRARLGRGWATRRSRPSTTPSWARTSSRSRPTRSRRRTSAPSTRRSTIASGWPTTRTSSRSAPTLRRVGRQLRADRDHRLAARDLDLHRAALRVEVRRAGADRADARHPDHGGVYALVGREVTTSTVAALLTIVGFSLYDTIIVFDRIRENIPRMPSAAFSQIVNRSMAEVIVRSLATSVLHDAAGAGAVLLRRRHAQGLRVRADRRHGLGRLLVGVHRRAGAHALEGPRARLPHARAPHPRRARLPAGLRRADRRARRSTSRRPSRAAAALDHRAAGPDAGLQARVRRHGARPRDRGAAPAGEHRRAARAPGGRPAGARQRRPHGRLRAAAGRRGPAQPGDKPGDGESPKPKKPRNRKHGRPR